MTGMASQQLNRQPLLETNIFYIQLKICSSVIIIFFNMVTHMKWFVTGNAIVVCTELKCDAVDYFSGMIFLDE